jgi:hypothetical protein
MKRYIFEGIEVFGGRGSGGGARKLEDEIGGLRRVEDRRFVDAG